MWRFLFGLAAAFLHAVFAAHGSGVEGLPQQQIVFRQRGALFFPMPKMIGQAAEFQVGAAEAGMIKAGGKLAVFPAPADKAVVEAVYGKPCRVAYCVA